MIKQAAIAILGLCGLATAGKSTAAAAFCGWERASFAATIRAEIERGGGNIVPIIAA